MSSSERSEDEVKRALLPAEVCDGLEYHQAVRAGVPASLWGADHRSLATEPTSAVNSFAGRSARITWGADHRSLVPPAGRLLGLDHAGMRISNHWTSDDKVVMRR